MTTRRCDACGRAELVPFADLGDIPVLCGVHWADAAEAAASPVGRMVLAYCPACAYVRNVAFDPALMVYDTTMDTNLHHSPAFQAFSADSGRRTLPAGTTWPASGCWTSAAGRASSCASCATPPAASAPATTPCTPVPRVRTRRAPTLHSGYAPRGADLPPFDMFTSRHWFEHIADPYEFLADLREQAGDRPVHGYLEVPDACYDLSTAGWEVIYPHVSYFDASSLVQMVQRAGWRVEDTGTLFGGMFRFIEVSANVPGPRTGDAPLPGDAERDRQLAAVASFAARNAAEREAWRERIAELVARGDNPVLWGAGSRGVQFLTFADPDRRLAAVVDVNPRKWGRYLPLTAHRVDAPDSLTELKPRAVIITNPSYRIEIGAQLRALGIDAELLVA